MGLRAGPGYSSLQHSVPVYPYTLAAFCSLAWPLVPLSAQPNRSLIVYQRTRRRILLPGLSLAYPLHDVSVIRSAKSNLRSAPGRRGCRG